MSEQKPTLLESFKEHPLIGASTLAIGGGIGYFGTEYLFHLSSTYAGTPEISGSSYLIPSAIGLASGIGLTFYILGQEQVEDSYVQEFTNHPWVGWISLGIGATTGGFLGIYIGLPRSLTGLISLTAGVAFSWIILYLWVSIDNAINAGKRAIDGVIDWINGIWEATTGAIGGAINWVGETLTEAKNKLVAAGDIVSDVVVEGPGKALAKILSEGAGKTLGEQGYGAGGPSGQSETGYGGEDVKLVQTDQGPMYIPVDQPTPPPPPEPTVEIETLPQERTSRPTPGEDVESSPAYQRLVTEREGLVRFASQQRGTSQGYLAQQRIDQIDIALEDLRAQASSRNSRNIIPEESTRARTRREAFTYPYY